MVTEIILKIKNNVDLKNIQRIFSEVFGIGIEDMEEQLLELPVENQSLKNIVMIISNKMEEFNYNYTVSLKEKNIVFIQ